MNTLRPEYSSQAASSTISNQADSSTQVGRNYDLADVVTLAKFSGAVKDGVVPVFNSSSVISSPHTMPGLVIESGTAERVAKPWFDLTIGAAGRGISDLSFPDLKATVDIEAVLVDQEIKLDVDKYEAKVVLTDTGRGTTKVRAYGEKNTDLGKNMQAELKLDENPWQVQIGNPVSLILQNDPKNKRVELIRLDETMTKILGRLPIIDYSKPVH